ncbi:MAG: hypothetical protein H6Q57_1913 [Geobacteraceae bacterium]|nr:hypothetical protein [Geobacteraceae bacterium]
MSESNLRGINLSIALVHHPVYDKNRSIVATAVTNLDLHDIARAARTFGLHRYYVVTPLEDQKKLASRIVEHWQTGFGSSYNPKRKEALDLVRITGRLEDVVQDLEKESGRKVKIVATGAKGNSVNIAFDEMRKLLEDATQPYLLLFGTGWGLADELLHCADYVLEPIRGAGTYNHLSVRSAAAIIMYRLLG